MNDYVPAVRFNNYTDSWRKCNLGDCVSYTKGFAFKSGEYRDEGIRIVRVSDLSSNAIKDNNEKKFIDKNCKDKYIKYQLNIGDIIITTVGSKAEMKDSAVGRPIIINKKIEGLLNQNLVKLFPIDKSNSYFIYGNLLKERYTNYIALIERGNANQANIALSDLWKHVVYLTSPEEQEKIGSFFSKLDNIITLQQQLIDDHKQLKKAMLQKMFPQKGESVPRIRFARFTDDWEQKEMGELAKIKTGKKDVQDADENGIYPFYIRSDEIKKINSYSFDGEAILVPGEGRLGDIIHYIKGKFDFHQRVYKISDFDGVSALYLLYFMKLNFKRHAMKYTVKATVDSLRLPMLKEFKILLPKLAEQEKIGNYFKQLDETIVLHEKKLETYQNLKKAMLQKMFV